MFIINLTYKVELDKIDAYLEAHAQYLKNQYANGSFIVSGRKVPRTGGIILSNVKSKEKLLEILSKDPFKINNLAEYDIVEFIPTMSSKEFELLIQ